MPQILDPTLVAVVNGRAYAALQTPRRNAANTGYEWGTAAWLDVANTFAQPQTGSWQVEATGASGALRFWTANGSGFSLGGGASSALQATFTGDPATGITRMNGGVNGLLLDQTNGFRVQRTDAVWTTLAVGLNGGVLLQNFVATDKGLIVRGAASQSANLQEWQDSSGSPLVYVSPAGNVFLTGGATGVMFASGNSSIARDGSDGAVVVNGQGSGCPALRTVAGSATSIGLTVRGNSVTQSAALVQLQGISSTSTVRPQADIDTTWVDSTDATRKARLVLRVWDTTAHDLLYLDCNGVVTFPTAAPTAPGAGTSSERWGAGATAAGDLTTVLGNGASSAGNYSASLGYQAACPGIQAVAVGFQASAGTQGVAIGLQAQVTGLGGGVAIGLQAHAYATAATAIGQSAAATAANSFALGAGATASHTGGIAIGIGASTTAVNQVVLGSAATPVNDVVIVGGSAGQVRYLLASSTAQRDTFSLVNSWADSTDATRKARLVLNVWDTAAREGLRLDATGTGVLTTVGDGTVAASFRVNSLTFPQVTLYTAGNLSAYLEASATDAHFFGNGISATIGTYNTGGDVILSPNLVEGLRVSYTGATPKIGVLGANAVARQTGDMGAALVTFGWMSGTPTFATDNLRGHLNAGRDAPMIAAVGTNTFAATITGNDSAGDIHIEWTSGLIMVSEEVAEVTFGTAFARSPYIVLQPIGSTTGATTSPIRVTAVSKTAFRLYFASQQSDVASDWHYHVVDADPVGL